MKNKKSSYSGFTRLPDGTIIKHFDNWKVVVLILYKERVVSIFIVKSEHGELLRTYLSEHKNTPRVMLSPGHGSLKKAMKAKKEWESFFSKPSNLKKAFNKTLFACGSMNSKTNYSNITSRQ